MIQVLSVLPMKENVQPVVNIFLKKLKYAFAFNSFTLLLKTHIKF